METVTKLTEMERDMWLADRIAARWRAEAGMEGPPDYRWAKLAVSALMEHKTLVDASNMKKTTAKTEPISILPCPFCGNPPKTKIDYNYRPGTEGLYISCESKGCVGPHITCPNPDDARQRWNRRTDVKVEHDPPSRS